MLIPVIIMSMATQATMASRSCEDQVLPDGEQLLNDLGAFQMPVLRPSSHLLVVVQREISCYSCVENNLHKC
jgi:hypothetical protein